MLDNFYKIITEETIKLRQYGKREFINSSETPSGFLGVALQDVTVFLIGLQNILGLYLGKEILRLDVGSPKKIDDPNDFLSAMKSVHRYFFISIQTSLEAAAERICKGRRQRERAFRFVLKDLKSTKIKWENFYEAIKILRNESAHTSTGTIPNKRCDVIRKAKLDFLLSETQMSVNCRKYLPVIELAKQCISDLESHFTNNS